MLFSTLATGFLGTALAAASAAGPTIKSVQPKGDVKNVEQIRVEFSQPIIAFGQPSAEAPVSSPCLQGGEGRWVDPTNWVFNFKKPLPGGVRCTIAVKKLKALDGRDVVGPTEFSFSTGGPGVQTVYPETWTALDEDQAFILFLDTSVKTATLADRAYLVVDGIGDKIPLKEVGGSDRRRLLEGFTKESSWKAKTHLRWSEKGGLKEIGPVLVMQTSRRLPYGAKVMLVWDRGIESESGVKVSEKQTYEFNVRADFRVEFTCQREAVRKPCIPLLAMNLSFTEGITAEEARRIYLQDENGKKYFPKLEGKKSDERSSWVEFPSPLPPMTKFKIFLPSGLKDESGRPLSNADKFPLEVATGEAPPLLKFAASFGLIEAGPGAALPVTVRDIEAKIPTTFHAEIFPAKGEVTRLGSDSFKKIVETAMRVQSQPYGESIGAADKTVRKIEIPRPLGGKEFEVFGIPFEKPGFYYVEMSSPRLGENLLKEPKPFFVRSTVLVTDLSVHLKYHGDSAFVWVTRLGKTTPVEGASVRLMTCTGDVLGSATTAADGTARIKSKTRLSALEYCGSGGWGASFFALAEKGDDFSFVASSWDQGIEPWRFRVNTLDGETVISHTILDRSLLRPGETLSMKHVLRKATADGFALFQNGLPKEAIIEHESGLQSFKFPLKWNAAMGTAETQWKIPAGAKLGHWSIRLASGDGGYSTVSFRIENFKVPLLKGHLRWPAENFIRVTQVPLDIAVEYQAGGPAGALETKLRWKEDDAAFVMDDQDLADYEWLTGGVQEGLVQQERYQEDEDADSESPAQGNPSKKGMKSSSLKLDAQGTGKIILKDLAPSSRLRTVKVEAEYRDPNGEIQTVGSVAKIWPSSWIVGLKARGWVQTKDRVEFEVAVVDLDEKAVSGAEVQVDAYKQDYITHRKRMIGGFYAYESFTETKKIGKLCSGKTDSRGRLVCKGRVDSAGTVVAVARVSDPQGRRAETKASQWLVESEERLWYGSSEGDRMDLIPSKKKFEPGETAEFQLRMPFKQARVLVTVEREGVLEHKIVEVDSTDPVIRLPVKESWAPNVFVSALAIRGRVDGVQPTALLDLGKPSYKMGLSEIRVGWKKYELKVKVDIDKKIARVRDKVKAHIQVADTAGVPTTGEVTVAVVDEGLLTLLPNKTWNLLEEMMAERPLVVHTATAQTQVVGKRHFGRKSVGAGGDGGKSVRELFDTLLLWKGTIPLNAKGEADVEIPVNDSLTSFRVVAIALNGRDQFGTGAATFRTTQDLMIFAGLPEVGREGDHLAAEFTVRNATSSPKSLKLKLDGDVPGAEKTLELKGDEAKSVSWDLKVPANTDAVSLKLVASENGRVLDQIKKSLKVVPVWPVRIQQATLQGVSPSMTTPIAGSSEAIAGSEAVRVELAASLVGNRSGLIEFWKNYPYTCLEQRASRAVTLNDKKQWGKVEAELDTYFDPNGRLKFFPSESEGSIVLTTYVAAVADEAGFKFSNDHRDKILHALTEFLAGRLEVGDGWMFPDLPLRRIAALDAVSRYEAFNPEMMAGLDITPNVWPSSSLVEFYGFLLRQSNVPNRAALLEQVESVVRSRMIFSGGKFAFSDEKVDSFWWLLRDAEWPTARLILAVAKNPSWTGDVPRIMRGSMEKQVKGAWLLTTTNAWGRLAMDRYKAQFEKSKVEGETEARIADQSYKYVWGKTMSNAGDLKMTGGKQELKIDHRGAGAPWALVQYMAAVPRLKPAFAGFNVEKTVEPLTVKSKDARSRGDLYRVRVKFTSNTDNSWVVIDEPLIPGAVVLGSGLGNDSSLQNEGRKGLRATFEERKSDSLRLYFGWLPKGPHEIEYRVRLNAAGEFKLPSTRIEAMYNPDLFGELPNADWKVVE